MRSAATCPAISVDAARIPRLFQPLSLRQDGAGTTRRPRCHWEGRSDEATSVKVRARNTGFVQRPTLESGRLRHRHRVSGDRGASHVADLGFIEPCDAVHGLAVVPITRSHCRHLCEYTN